MSKSDEQKQQQAERNKIQAVNACREYEVQKQMYDYLTKIIADLFRQIEQDYINKYKLSSDHFNQYGLDLNNIQDLPKGKRLMVAIRKRKEVRRQLGYTKNKIRQVGKKHHTGFNIIGLVDMELEIELDHINRSSIPPKGNISTISQQQRS